MTPVLLKLELELEPVFKMCAINLQKSANSAINLQTKKKDKILEGGLTARWGGLVTKLGDVS